MVHCLYNRLLHRIYKGPLRRAGDIELAPLNSPFSVKPGAFVELRTWQCVSDYHCDCSDSNIRQSTSAKLRMRAPFANPFSAFYEKCGYAKKENEMVRHIAACPVLF